MRLIRGIDDGLVNRASRCDRGVAIRSAAGFLFLFSMIFVPTSYQVERLALLVLALIGSGLRVIRGRAAMDTSVVTLFYFYIVAGLVFGLHGLFEGTAGAWPNVRLFALWPFIYAVLVAGSSSNWSIWPRVWAVLATSLAAVELYALIYILVSQDIAPRWMYLELDLGQNIGFYRGFTAFTLYNVSSLVFLVPLTIAALIVWPRTSSKSAPVPRTLLYLLAGIGCALAVASGRRGLIVAILAAPVLSLWVRRWGPVPSERRRVKPWLVGSILAGTSLLWVFSSFADVVRSQTSYVYAEMVRGIQLADASTSLRAKQFGALIEGWWFAPTFGHGLGAHLPDLIVSAEQPWAYELSYVALLFQVGFVGVLVYAAGIVWIWRRCRQIASTDPAARIILLPILVAMVCFLLANATNPYLAKFDYLWVIFLPVAVINGWSVKESLGMPTCPVTSESTPAMPQQLDELAGDVTPAGDRRSASIPGRERRAT